MDKDKNCYECKHRGDIPGDAHSRCEHPALKKIIDDPLAAIITAAFASADGIAPKTDIKSLAKEFQIKANPTGIRKGWFNWPWNFDPVWLENCDAFEKKDKKEENDG